MIFFFRQKNVFIEYNKNKRQKINKNNNNCDIVPYCVDEWNFALLWMCHFIEIDWIYHDMYENHTRFKLIFIYKLHKCKAMLLVLLSHFLHLSYIEFSHFSLSPPPPFFSFFFLISSLITELNNIRYVCYINQLMCKITFSRGKIYIYIYMYILENVVLFSQQQQTNKQTDSKKSSLNHSRVLYVFNLLLHERYN